MADLIAQNISFLFRSLKFGDGVLIVAVGDAEQDIAEISFNYVRSFAFLKESDFFKEFQQYDLVPLVGTSERTLGVFSLRKGAVLERVLCGRLDAENPQYFWVSTPDECLEIVGFEGPQMRMLLEAQDK